MFKYKTNKPENKNLPKVGVTKLLSQTKMTKGYDGVPASLELEITDRCLQSGSKIMHIQTRKTERIL